MNTGLWTIFLVACVISATLGSRPQSKALSKLKKGSKTYWFASDGIAQLSEQYPDVSREGFNDLERIAEALENTRLPKGLNRLLFKGNETFRLYDLENPGLRTEGDDEYACINRCADKIEAVRGNPDDLLSCNQAGVAVKCVQECQKNGGVLVPYLLPHLAWFQSWLCDGSVDTKTNETKEIVINCVIAYLGNTPQLVNLTRQEAQCYMDLEETHDVADACSVLKNNCARGIFEQVIKNCPNYGHLKVVEAAFVYGLTYLSDGRLVNTCPALYSNQ